ncbi:MAG: hypothetical protein MZW92_50655 [Comamonadaceae bacterium]|nr:hypothetical protein [Comamonadaceae bacterium]
MFNQKGGVGKTTDGAQPARGDRASAGSAPLAHRPRPAGPPVAGVRRRRPRRADDTVCGFFVRQTAARGHRADHPQRRRALPGAPRPRQARRAARQEPQRRSPGCARALHGAGARRRARW